MTAETRAGAAVTPRLDQCLATGSMETLFPLLAGWSPKELRALRRDLARYYRIACEEMETSYRRLALLPANLADPARQRLIDHAYQQQRMAAVMMAAEIHGVILFYLDAQRVAARDRAPLGGPRE